MCLPEGISFCRALGTVFDMSGNVVGITMMVTVVPDKRSIRLERLVAFRNKTTRYTHCCFVESSVQDSAAVY